MSACSCYISVGVELNIVQLVGNKLFVLKKNVVFITRLVRSKNIINCGVVIRQLRCVTGCPKSGGVNRESLVIA